jgi:hypothetical protein
MCNILFVNVHPLLGNRLVNEFPQRQILGKQSVARSHNNKMNVYSSLLSTGHGVNHTENKSHDGYLASTLAG